ITLALHTAKPRISALVPDAPPALDAWFAKMCAREPDERYQTAREAAHALTEAAGETVAGPALLRAPMPSSPSLEYAPTARDSDRSGPGERGGERAVTNLSSSYGVHSSPRRKKPPILLLVGAILVLGVLGFLVAFAALRKTDDDVATTPSASG